MANLLQLRRLAADDIDTVLAHYTAEAGPAIATGFTSDQYKDAIAQGYAWLGGFAELRNITWVDLPTSHWPMWSRPQELAEIIGDVARRAGAS